jgi:gliding motility-associated-like protein
MGRKILFTLLVFLFFSNQKTLALDLQVTVTNETCIGTADGSLSFTVTNQTVGIPVFYSIYLLPNTTTPIVTTSSNSYGGLTAGNYLIIASQTVNGDVITDEQTVILANQIAPPTFVISDVKEKCGNDGQIIVNVISGTVVSYQLYSGPVTTGLQPLNIFSNLPAGQYVVRVFDVCGQAYSQTHTLTSLNPSLVIGPAMPSNFGNISCNTLFIGHGLSALPNTQVFNPLSYQVTAYPPSGGSPIVTTQTSMPLVVPSVNGVSYFYDLQITDACGNIYTRNNNQASSLLNFTTATILSSCSNYFLDFTVQRFVGSYTINFVSAPAGFNPLLANPSHPGPFTTSAVTYGNASYFMPLGSYTIEITDSCGNTRTKTFTIQDVPSTVISTINAPACGGNGSISLGLNPYRELATVILTSAPSGYPNPLPENLSSLIFSGGFSIQNVPPGYYFFSLTDVCGNPYTSIVLLEGTPEIPNVVQRPGCAIGDGSVGIFFPSASIVSIEIQNAPSTFGFALPYDVTFNVDAGNFSMNSLPEGNYKFKIIDSCGFESFVDVILIGFEIVSSTYVLEENCGSFNLQLNHQSNGTDISNPYRLQKYDVVNNVWEHPSTGADYVPGTFLDDTNSIALQNNTNNINLAFSGTFRVVKMFFNYTNATFLDNICILPLHEFEFSGVPKIVNAYAFPCDDNTQEVVIIATGLPPLQYSITKKDGLSFIVNNGTSNIFSGLAPGIYEFKVEDTCGNERVRSFNVSLLEQPEITASNLCNGTNGQLEIQDFPFVTYQWYNVQNPSVILSTSNTLQFSPFNSVNDTGTYEVQLSTTNANSCIDQTIQYTISPAGFNPNAGNDNSIALCKEDNQVSLNSFLTNPHDAGGTWTDSNGDIVTITLINPIDFNAGNYTYTYSVNWFCAAIDVATITIVIKDIPETPVLSAPTLICRGDDILLEASLGPNATYFWTGPNGFTSTDQNPLLLNYDSNNDGSYFVYAAIDGCYSATEEIILNSNPLPDFSIDGVTSICTGQNETLTINPVNFGANLVTIEWYFNGILLSTQTSETLQINQFGNYSVSIQNNGCSTLKEIEVVEKINSFDVVLEQGCNQKDYEINIVNAQDFQNATYVWTGSNGFTSYAQNIIVPNLEIGTYNVEVTDIMGCKSSSSAIVENTNCFIPNGFSPDEDGFNDSFDLTGFNVKKIYIYNRYGRLVYDKDNYTNEWKGQTNNNKRLPASTYFYVLEFNEGENKTGWVYVSY